MSKHTPGPWRWQKMYKDGKLSSMYYINSDTLMVGNVDPCASMSIAESHANARLIAAAPDLLEALKLLVGCIVTDSVGNIRALLPIAMAAIAKAKGKEN